MKKLSKKDLIKMMREHPNLTVMEGKDKVVVKVKSIKENLVKVPKPKKPKAEKPAPKKRGRKKKEPFLTATKESGEVVELKERKPRKRKVNITDKRKGKLTGRTPAERKARRDKVQKQLGLKE